MPGRIILMDALLFKTARQPSLETRTQTLNEIIEVYVYPPFTLQPFLTPLLVSVHGPVEPNIILPGSISITIIPIIRNLIKACARQIHLAPFEGPTAPMDRSQFSWVSWRRYELRDESLLIMKMEKRKLYCFEILHFSSTYIVLEI